jgi:hypothetical protein
MIPQVYACYPKGGAMVVRVACTKCRFTADLIDGRYAACPKCAQQVTETVISDDYVSGSPRSLMLRRLGPNALHHFKTSIAQQLQALYGVPTAHDS